MSGFTSKEAYAVTRDAREKELKEQFFADSRPPLLDWLEERALIVGMAEALIAIVGQPWEWSTAWNGVNEASRQPYAPCPVCRSGGFLIGSHYDGCPWLIAARALGIA